MDLTVEEKRQLGLRPNAPAYQTTPLLSVGKRVRVQVADTCRRALIEYIDDDAATVDVAYECPSGNDQSALSEEATVPTAAVRSLEDFEVAPEAEQKAAYNKDVYSAAAATKEGANTLFKLKDFEAAADHYTLGIDELRQLRPCGVTSQQWVLVNQGGTLACGSLQRIDVASRKADVRVLRKDSSQEQITEGAPWRTLILVHRQSMLLQSSLYMNRARCMTQLGRHQEAAQDLSIVIALWSAIDVMPSDRPLSDAEVAEQQEQLSKAYYLRAKSRLSRLRVEPARADLRHALMLRTSEATGKLLKQLEREIEAAHKEVMRSNKRLVKELSKFAEGALQNLDGATLEALDDVLPR